MVCGFTLEHYFETLQRAKELGYAVVPVSKYALDKKKIILLRHDIDFSMQLAHQLAFAEFTRGITSTYYVFFHSTYNVLRLVPKLREIISLGHEIGLHYDSRYDIGNEHLLLENIIGGPVQSVTQHFPAATKLNNYHKLINPNKLKKFKYLSDSGRNWREGCLCTHLEEFDKMHINIHPIWWVGKSVSREDAVNKLENLLHGETNDMIGKVKKMLSDYVKDLKL